MDEYPFRDDGDGGSTTGEGSNFTFALPETVGLVLSPLVYGGKPELEEEDASALSVESSSLIQMLATSSKLTTPELPEAPIARSARSLLGSPASAEPPAPLPPKTAAEPWVNPPADEPWAKEFEGYEDLNGGMLPSAEDREEEDAHEADNCDSVPSTTKSRL